MMTMAGNNKRRLEDINSNFTKSFLFKTIQAAHPTKSDLATAGLVNNHIKTNSHIFLSNPYKPPPIKHKPSKHPLSNKERKALKINQVKDGDIKFQDILPLHSVWCQYAGEFRNKMDDIARMDFHGCYLTVTQTMVPGLLNKSGIVAMETMNTFTLVDKQDKSHVVPKRRTVFSFVIEASVFCLYGNNLLYRPGERIMKKVGKPKIATV
eukprot:sb/3470310/